MRRTCPVKTGCGRISRRRCICPLSAVERDLTAFKGRVEWAVHLHGRAGLGILIFCLLLPIAAPAGRTGPPASAPGIPSAIGTPDEDLRLLFTPASLPPGTFVVHRSVEDIGRLAARLKTLDPAPAEGAWRVERAGVFDAFGAEGPYDKARVARLFGGASPAVARGSLVTAQGRLAFTLISPYPDVSLSSLRKGTMVIVTKLPVR